MDGNITAASYPIRLITEDEYEYIATHFSIRLKYLKQIRVYLERSLTKIENIKAKPVTIYNFSNKAFLEKALTEIWLLFEEQFRKEDISERDVSLLRHRAFQLFGIDDKNYSKARGHIMDRLPDKRFAVLDSLLNTTEKRKLSYQKKVASSNKKKIESKRKSE